MQIRGIVRTIKCHIESSTQEPLNDESPILPWLVEHAGCILSRCQKVVMGRHHSKDCVERGRRKNSFRLEREGAGETSLHRYREQNDSKIQVRYLARNAQPLCRMLHWECRWRIQSSRSQKAGTSEQTGQRSHQQCDWSSFENDRRQMDSGQTRNTSRPSSCPSTAIRRCTDSEEKESRCARTRAINTCSTRSKRKSS